MKSRNSFGRKPGRLVCSSCKQLRIILTRHARSRIKTRIEEPLGERMAIHGLPHVRVLEIWDNLTERVLHGLLVNGGALLLGKLDATIPEFVALTLLTADQLHVTGKTRGSRLIPLSATVYEVPASYAVA